MLKLMVAILLIAHMDVGTAWTIVLITTASAFALVDGLLNAK